MSISLLPVRLQLLTFPKESLPFVAHAILKNVLFKKKNKFFSYTENSMEISIIADVETIEKDFPKNNSPTCPGICICEDPFRALQIDNEYGLEMSGKRINDLSAPLARAGISIFYLSTYQTDFIFVKEKRIPLVISVLKKSFQFIDLDLLNIEFPLYLNNNDDLLPPENVSSWLSYEYDGSEEVYANGNGKTGTNKDNDTNKIGGEETGEETEREIEEATDKLGALNIPRDFRQRSYSNDTAAMGWSYSPTYEFSSLSLSNKLHRQEDILAEVRRQCKKSLSDKNLRLIGLNREYIDGWALTMMKIMFYPELLKTEEELENENNSSRFFSYTSTSEGISLIVEEQILDLFEEHMINVSLTPRHLRCIQIDLTTFGVGTLRLDRCGIVYSMSDPLTKAGINLLYLSTFKTANVLVNESLINQTLEVLDIYDDDKKDNENKEEEKSEKSDKSENTEIPPEANSNSNTIDVNLKDLDLYDTQIKDYGTLAKINPYKDSNYFRGGAVRINSENNYLYNNNNSNNKMMNYGRYKANSVSSLSSSTVINQISYDNNMQYANNHNHMLNGNHLTNNTNMNHNEKNRNSLSPGIGLTNMYAPQSQYSVSISPTTVTAEPSSTTMNTVTTKPSNTMSSPHYITNRSYYDYNYDSKISSYATNNNYNKQMEGPNLNNTNNNMQSNTISYFQQYHPINSTRLSSDVYTSSGFTFK